MKLIIKWLIGGAALFAAPYLIPGIAIANFYTALVASFVLGLLNITVRPVLKLLALPLNLITFGLFTLVINAGIFWFLSTIVKGLDIDGFMAAFLGSLFVSAVLFAVHLFIDRD
ncbi:phage holin family protein [Candidatus Parcubacteria bacterium]|nr:phage holin family protein [Candidatus Parcubacteria bacterium]